MGGVRRHFALRNTAALALLTPSRSGNESRSLGADDRETRIISLRAARPLFRFSRLRKSRCGGARYDDRQENEMNVNVDASNDRRDAMVVPDGLVVQHFVVLEIEALRDRVGGR